MLCRDSRASSTSISGFGGGGAWMDIWVEACVASPRESVQLALTVMVPGDAPDVLRVAELPLPAIVPLVDVQLATFTGTPSGLVQLADRFTVPPGITEDGLAEIDMVGGFFGGNGLTVKFAEQLASLFFLSFGSVMRAVTA
jgi:hypothetical protein